MSVEDFGPAPALIAPGMIMRYTISLGQDHAVQFEASFDRDAEPEMRHSLDVCYREGNRLLGKNQLPILRRQLAGKEEQLQDNRVRKAEVEAKLKTLRELRDVKVLEISRRRDDLLKQDQNAWLASGKRGKYQPQGHIAGDLKRYDAELNQLLEGQQREDGDGPQQIAVLDGEIKECARNVDQLKTLVAEAEAMVRGEDVSGIVEE